MLSEQLKEDIKNQLINSIKKKIAKYDFTKKSGNPLIDGLFGKNSSIKSFIHGTATTLGSDYELIARKIATSNPTFVVCEKKSLVGQISDAESAVIKNIAKDLEETRSGSSYETEIKEVYHAKGGNLKSTKIVIDLYLKDKLGKEFFIEMKGPDPNKKEVRAAKEDLLNVVAMKKRTVELAEFQERVAIIFGVYYNNLDGKYKNWKVSPMFEHGKGLLIQEDFWELIGGKGTFEELKDLFKEVGQASEAIIREAIERI